MPSLPMYHPVIAWSVASMRSGRPPLRRGSYDAPADGTHATRPRPRRAAAGQPAPGRVSGVAHRPIRTGLTDAVPSHRRCHAGLMGGDGEDLWEAHAGWWQDGFTEGADPEYEEQILPLAAQHLAGARAGARRRLRRRSGRPARPGGGATLVVGVDPTAAQVAVAAARGGGRLRPGGRRGAPVRRRRLRRRRRLPRVRAHPRHRRRHRGGGAGAGARRPLPLLPEPPAAADARTAAGSTTRCSTRPSSTGGSVPT